MRCMLKKERLRATIIYEQFSFFFQPCDVVVIQLYLRRFDSSTDLRLHIKGVEYEDPCKEAQQSERMNKGHESTCGVFLARYLIFLVEAWETSRLGSSLFYWPNH